MKNTSFTGGNLGAVPAKDTHKSSLAYGQQSTTPANKRGNFFHHMPAIGRLICKVKAHFIVSGVKSALKEVEMIEKGVKKTKSLDQVLNEL